MMTKERRAELEALADKDPHMCLLRELLNEIAELEARAVVVPEPTSQQWINEVLDPAYLEGEPFAVIRYATKWFRRHLRAIPADRVLGEWRRMDSAPTEPWSKAILADDEGRVGEGVLDGGEWVWKYNEKLAFPEFWMPLPVAPGTLRTQAGKDAT